MPRSYDLGQLTFGVEIEFKNLYRSNAAQAITDAGVECHVENYNHQTRDHWKVTTDASLGRGYGSGEVVSPVLQGEAGIQEMRKVAKALSRAGARIDRSCGIHVHIGVAGMNLGAVKRAVKMYAKYEATIDMMMPKSRRGNTNSYCRSLISQYSTGVGTMDRDAVKEFCDKVDSAPSMEHMAEIRGLSGRFHKINLRPWWRQGTIEFRHHAGTLDATKLENWVRFLTALVNCAANVRRVHNGGPRQGETARSRFNKMCQDMVPTAVKAYYQRRITTLNGAAPGRRAA